MKILWLTNKIIPRVHQAMGKYASLVNEGWISQMFDLVCDESDVEMNIVCCGASEYVSGKTEKFSWHVVAEDRKTETYYNDAQRRIFIRILEEVQPDLIHIWGSEFPHTLAMVRAAKDCGISEKVVISLQGIISLYSYYYYYAGLPLNVVQSKTICDRIRKTCLMDQEHGYAQRGQHEMEALREIKHVIGRTDWDKNASLLINPDLNYHFCNETLRSEFYTGNWNVGGYQKNRLFVSQGSYPIKGLHMLIDAMPKVLKKYPDMHVYVGGSNPTDTSSLIAKLKLSAYGKYLKQKIAEYKLEDHVTFLGRLNAEQMKEQYLLANAFVSCSSIENSPNSVGEAMLLGTPVISSDVGGVRTILHAPEEGILYCWDDTEALAEAIIEVFEHTDEAITRADAARIHAQQTHDAKKNYETLLQIYNDIVDDINRKLEEE